MDIVTELYKISRSDLEASECLYNNKHYTQSLFYFQQAVEKANKSFFLHLEVIKPENLKKSIGHYPLKIYKMIMEKQKLQIEEYFRKTSSFPKARDTIFHKQVEQYKKALENGLKMLDSFKYDLPSLIRELSSIKEPKKIKLTRRLKMRLKAEFLKSSKEFVAFISSFQTSQAIKAREQLKKISTNDIDKFPDTLIKFLNPMLFYMYAISCVLSTLYSTAVITLPHSTDTRYPNIEKNMSPLLVYKKKLSIIKYLPYFFVLFKKALSLMPKLFNPIAIGKNRSLRG